MTLSRDIPLVRSRSALFSVDIDMREICNRPEDGECASVVKPSTITKSLLRNGRDRTRVHEITGFHVPGGSRDGLVIDEPSPARDGILLHRTSLSVLVSTLIDHVHRNLGVHQIVVKGLLTDPSIGNAIRDACDLGCCVNLVGDARATRGRECDGNSPTAVRDYCREDSADALLAHPSEMHS